jgi:hypothetical protein
MNRIAGRAVLWALLCLVLAQAASIPLTSAAPRPVPAEPLALAGQLVPVALPLGLAQPAGPGWIL